MKLKREIEENDKLFFNQIFKKYSSKDFDINTKIYRDFINNFIFENFIINNYNKILMMEVGCGIGSTSRLISNYNIDYIGIDYSKELIKIAKKNFETDKIKFKCLNIKDSNYHNLADIIFMNGALHHMTDLDLVLHKFEEILKVDGCVIALEPLDNNLLFKFFRIIRKKIDKNYSSDQFFFDYTLINKIFKNKNIEHEVIPFGFFTPPLAQIKLPFKLNIIFFKVFSFLDTIIYKYFPMFIQKYSWNVIIKFRYKK